MLLDIVLIVLEALIILAIAFYCLRKKVFFSKSTLVFFVPILLILISYYVRAVYKVEGDLHFITFFQSIADALSSFAFKINDEYILEICRKDALFATGFFVAVATAGYTTVSVCVGFFYIWLVNFLKVRVRLSRGCDIVIGFSDESVKYIKRTPNALLLTDRTLNKDERKNLYAQGIPYIEKKVSKASFASISRQSSDLHFILFTTDYDYVISTIKAYGPFVKENSKAQKTTLHLEVGEENLATVKDFYISDETMSNHIFCFNRYDFISQRVFMSHPFTEFLTPAVLDTSDGTLSEDTVFNVFLIGFGHTNKEMLKKSVMLHQFVTASEDKKRLEPLLLNYYIFDKSEQTRNDKNNAHNFHRFERFMKRHPDATGYLPFPSMTHNYEFVNEDINHDSFNEKIAEIIEKSLDGKRKSVNMFIVSFGSDIDNIDYTAKIIKSCREEGFLDNQNFILHCYTKVRSKFIHDNFPLDEGVCTYFGSLNDVFTHDTIVNESIYKMAYRIHQAYSKTNPHAVSWNRLDVLKRRSNIYASLHIRLKLHLAGLDYYPLEDEDIEEVDLEAILGTEVYNYEAYDIEDRKATTLRKTLAYIEHLRWNAFHIMNGFVPMELSTIRKNADGRIIKDKTELRTHACLTTYYGLDRYADIVTLIKNDLPYENGKIDPDDALWEAKMKSEVYIYDFQNVDNMDQALRQAGYKIGLKKRQ